MKRMLNIVLIWLLAFLSGCAVTEFDRSVDFASLRKFSWGKSEVNASNPLHKGDLVDKKIKAVVLDEFQKKGIVEVEKNPDFYVSYRTFTEKKEERVNNYGPLMPYGRFGYHPYAYYRYFGWYFPYYYGGFPGEKRAYTEGTLVLDIVDAKTKETVWRGSVSGNIDNVKGLQRQLEKGVRAILKKYPVKVTPDSPNVLPPKDVIG